MKLGKNEARKISRLLHELAVYAFDTYAFAYNMGRNMIKYRGTDLFSQFHDQLTKRQTLKRDAKSKDKNRKSLVTSLKTFGACKQMAWKNWLEANHSENSKGTSSCERNIREHMRLILMKF